MISAKWRDHNCGFFGRLIPALIALGTSLTGFDKALAKVPPEIARLCEEYALKAHVALGCRGTSRTDYRWDDELGEAGLFALETNTQPGMTPLSLVPEQARHAGIDYAELVDLIVQDALRVHASKETIDG